MTTFFYFLTSTFLTLAGEVYVNVTLVPNDDALLTGIDLGTSIYFIWWMITWLSYWGKWGVWTGIYPDSYYILAFNKIGYLFIILMYSSC